MTRGSRFRWLVIAWLALGIATAFADAKKAAVHNKLGKAYFEAKQFDDAVREFTLSYDADPKPVTLFKIASAYYAKGDYKGAIEFYSKYLAADPKGPYAEDAATFSTVANKALADEEAKKKAADEAARLEADRKKTEAETEAKRVAAMVHVKQAEAYARASAWVSAGDEYTVAAEVAANPELLLDAAAAYKKQPHNVKARAALLAYLDKVPLGPKSEDLRGQVASLTTQIDKADAEARLLEAKKQEDRLDAQLGGGPVIIKPYRYQTIFADLVSDTLVIAAFASGDGAPTSGGRAITFYAGTLITLGATPILHWRHHNDNRAVASGLARVVAIATGTFIAIGQGHTAYLDPGGFAYVAVPIVAIQILDATFFAKEKVHVKRSAATVVVLPTSGGATFGLGGTF